MDILKEATDWARAEVFSSLFFILFGVSFLAATIGFWQLGKTEVAKAYIFPTLVAGVLLLAVGMGIFFANKSRTKSFVSAYEKNPTEFVESEIGRTQQSMGEYKTIVFKVIPLIVLVATILIIFIDKPIWRAIGITTISMMVIIMLVDSNADARIKEYNGKLLQVNDGFSN